MFSAYRYTSQQKQEEIPENKDLTILDRRANSPKDKSRYSQLPSKGEYEIREAIKAYKIYIKT
jgi:hypothetical protein